MAILNVEVGTNTFLMELNSEGECQRNIPYILKQLDFDPLFFRPHGKSFNLYPKFLKFTDADDNDLDPTLSFLDQGFGQHRSIPFNRSESNDPVSSSSTVRTIKLVRKDAVALVAPYPNNIHSTSDLPVTDYPNA